MKRRIAASCVSLFWGVFTYLGYRLMVDIAQRHVYGYPNAEQWRYCVYFPLILLIISIGVLLLARRMSVRLFATTSLLQLLLVVAFLIRYSRGI
jgi:hypothetical protein